MCGIVAYLGHRQASDVIIKGLKRLEYRGYDSTGIALLNGDLNVYKRKVKFLSWRPISKASTSTVTSEWATHAGPHTESRTMKMHILIIQQPKKLAIIHNGIIENYASLKKELTRKGHIFLSDTRYRSIHTFLLKTSGKRAMPTGRSGTPGIDQSRRRLRYRCDVVR